MTWLFVSLDDNDEEHDNDERVDMSAHGDRLTFRIVSSMASTTTQTSTKIDGDAICRSVSSS